MSVTFSHRGICVSDLQRSTAFYQDALGFAPCAGSGTFEGSAPNVSTGFLRNVDGVALELLQYFEPLASGTRERRPNNRYGLTHLAFYVDDIGAVANRVRLAGGMTFEHTRARYEEGGTEMMYCTDPDGTRLELMQAPEVAPRFSHSGICVPDIEGALRCYRDVLGFVAAENYDLQNHSSWLDVINELDSVRLRAQMICNAGNDTLELLRFTSPDAIGSRSARPLNRFGLSHLAFHATDPVRVAAHIAAAGGHILATDAVNQNSQSRLFCADANGVRIVLLRH